MHGDIRMHVGWCFFELQPHQLGIDYLKSLWYYHHVIVFCATPIQAFQSVSEPHTLLSLYFSQQHHYAAEQWAVDFFVFEGTFSPAARMTPAMPSAGASI